MIEVAILAHLLAGPDVAAIVGTRGYQLILPQKPTLPALRTQLIDEPEDVNLAGELTNFFRARVQVDVWAPAASGNDPYVAARAAAVAIRDRLALRSAGGQQFVAGDPGATVAVTSVQVVDKAIEYEADEFRAVRARTDFSVVYYAM